MKYSKEFHAHFCKTCGNWWEHHAPPADAPESVNDEAHTCKCCGKEVWTWMDEEELADAIRRFAVMGIASYCLTPSKDMTLEELVDYVRTREEEYESTITQREPGLAAPETVQKAEEVPCLITKQKQNTKMPKPSRG